MRASERREAYIVTLRPEPHTDPIRALRRGLKYLLRVCGLRAIHVREQNESDAVVVAQSIADRHGRRARGAARKARPVPAKDRGDAGAARSLF
jgi:hypothetical protein